MTSDNLGKGMGAEEFGDSAVRFIPLPTFLCLFLFVQSRQAAPKGYTCALDEFRTLQDQRWQSD
jgi:hypothetical protein